MKTNIGYANRGWRKETKHWFQSKKLHRAFCRDMALVTVECIAPEVFKNQDEADESVAEELTYWN